MNIDFTGIRDILNYDKILISGHKNPDGDSVGSALALALILRKLGKSPDIYIKELPEHYKMLNGTEMYTSTVDNNYDLFIALDSGDKDRVEEVAKQFENAKMTYNIDHHISNTNFAMRNYVTEASSTGEIIFHVAKELGAKIDKDIASAIFLAIISDTGLYQYKNTTSETYAVVTELMKNDIDFDRLIRELFFERTYEQTKLLGRALENMELLFDKRVALSTITFKELKDINAKTNEINGIVNTIMQIKGLKIAIFMYEPAPNNVKVSFRSMEPYNVCEIAQKLDGGGHILAAGAITKGRMDEIKEMVLKLVSEAINK
ncbi:MAG: hypothetical protein A2Y24_06645 [Clostridiales bacterium GWE2_32_10]|nr:MAG: hypothetical protein A2Y24_06645 [Clostridiales bacterium GWE2_32_10]HBY20195.1 hypothetical protein [Clostridiales bacterium]